MQNMCEMGKKWRKNQSPKYRSKFKSQYLTRLWTKIDDFWCGELLMAWNIWSRCYVARLDFPSYLNLDKFVFWTLKTQNEE
jgi:hypothetical protein